MKVFRVGVLIGLLSIVPAVFADTESELEAEKLFTIMGMEEAMVQSISQMLDLQLQQKPSLAPFKSVMLSFFTKHMSWESLKPDFIRIYSEEFTASELRDINEFYATDTGKKTIKRMPSLMVQGGQVGAARVQANRGDLQAMIKAESERLQKLSEQ